MSQLNKSSSGTAVLSPAVEKLLLLILAAIQFTTVLDFLIIIPLGPQYMRVFSISPYQFEIIVGAYGLSAGIAGLAAVLVLDKFDRKKALVWLYAGFALGTLYCGAAPTYHQLVFARLFAGAFGGICGPIILSIVGDVIPMERRGRAMGLVMSSFSVASIIGVPAGLFMAIYYSWHVPFFAIAAISALVLIVAVMRIPPLTSHLQHAEDTHPMIRAWEVMTHPNHLKAYLFMAALTCAGMCIFSFIPTYMVKNVGLTQEQVPLIYLFGGISTVFSMNWIGKWADLSGKHKVFTITSLSTAVPVLLITNLPHVPLVVAIATSTLLMVCMSGRMVPAMALMTGVVEARYRGGFMSVNSSVQQFSMGLTSILCGIIVGTDVNDRLTHFPINGIISIFCAYSCIYLARYLKVPETTLKGETPGEPAFVEM
jgi:predicted MFS family arabinose efflux permease